MCVWCVSGMCLMCIWCGSGVYLVCISCVSDVCMVSRVACCDMPVCLCGIRNISYVVPKYTDEPYHFINISERTRSHGICKYILTAYSPIVTNSLVVFWRLSGL